jgi:hypothetical protein
MIRIPDRNDRFELMREKGIRRAFAFDDDVVDEGFETVP